MISHYVTRSSGDLTGVTFLTSAARPTPCWRTAACSGSSAAPWPWRRTRAPTAARPSTAWDPASLGQRGVASRAKTPSSWSTPGAESVPGPRLTVSLSARSSAYPATASVTRTRVRAQTCLYPCCRPPGVCTPCSVSASPAGALLCSAPPSPTAVQ